ncbi:MAG: prepilin-type N-terminal cleavage/methylation domain-containing protein [Phycisphaerales bacterium]|nr:prepilin-type N-terminal cleavage/methylation domain-containing protein [Phycisphaerales bacterium]
MLPSLNFRRRSHTSPQGFTLIEVMVVISIIVVLAGILLVALGTATDSARRASTTATLNSFRAACDSFALDHDSYPGVLPESAMGDGLRISSTQNAMLHLMGGYRLYNDSTEATQKPAYDAYKSSAQSENRPFYELTPTDSNTGSQWHLIVVPSRMGEGPVIDGKPYSPYYAPKDSEMSYNVTGGNNYPNGLNEAPNLVDAWKTPILYFRQGRSVGPVVGSSDTPGMYTLDGQQLYLRANRLGDLGFSQAQAQGVGSRLAFEGTNSGGIGGGGGSNNDPSDEQIRWLTLLLSHPAFYDPDQPTYGTPRSKYMLMSAGKDGVFLGRYDGPVNESGSFDFDHESATHEDLDSFDDVVIYGGG